MRHMLFMLMRRYKGFLQVMGITLLFLLPILGIVCMVFYTPKHPSWFLESTKAQVLAAEGAPRSISWDGETSQEVWTYGEYGGCHIYFHKDRDVVESYTGGNECRWLEAPEKL